MILFPLQFADVGCGYFLRQDYRNGLDGRKLKRVMRMFNRRDSIKGNPMLRSIVKKILSEMYPRLRIVTVVISEQSIW